VQQAALKISEAVHPIGIGTYLIIPRCHGRGDSVSWRGVTAAAETTCTGHNKVRGQDHAPGVCPKDTPAILHGVPVHSVPRCAVRSTGRYTCHDRQETVRPRGGRETGLGHAGSGQIFPSDRNAVRAG